MDFGTSNTVIARLNETTGLAETLAIPEVSSELRYRLTPGGPEQSVWVTPTMIHYAAGETVPLVGDQVVARGLAEHSYTMRWMKPGIAKCATWKTQTGHGFKSPAEAGEDFLKWVLTRAVPQISLRDDTFTFTVPVEAFEDFQDWIWRVAESLGIGKFRILDEPTAAVFGYHGAARPGERFAVFDFGGGTLDVAVVRLDPTEKSGRKAVQLGMAGCDLGGMNIDLWIADSFRQQHRLGDVAARELENLILREAESVKIQLSDPEETEAEMRVLDGSARAPRLLRTTFARNCPQCDPAGMREAFSKNAAGRNAAGTNAVCLGCLLVANDFPKRVRETLDGALENAAVKSGMGRSEITRLLVTGGTSLVPAVRRILEEAFGDKVQYDHPFDCVVRGACRAVVEPVLKHDYAIQTRNRARSRDELVELFPSGTEFPTEPEAAQFWANGSWDGQTRVGLMVFEVSRMVRRAIDESAVDKDGRILNRAMTEFQHICLNKENPTFIDADPPIRLDRDKQRFVCSFEVDGNRRLLVSVVDQFNGRQVLKGHPVVRL